MKAFPVHLIVLASSVAAQFRSLSLSASVGCPSAEQIVSYTVTLGGNDIKRQKFLCPYGLSEVGASQTTALQEKAADIFQNNTSSERRSANECTVPAPNCQCGTSSECSCIESGAIPSTSDCTTLINSTSIISEIEGPTFFVLPANLEVITFQTCSLAFANLASTVLEFCWDDLSTVAGLSAGCLGQGFSSGVCVADDGFYLTRIGHTGSS